MSPNHRWAGFPSTSAVRSRNRWETVKTSTSPQQWSKAPALAAATAAQRLVKVARRRGQLAPPSHANLREDHREEVPSNARSVLRHLSIQFDVANVSSAVISDACSRSRCADTIYVVIVPLVFTCACSSLATPQEKNSNEDSSIARSETYLSIGNAIHVVLTRSRSQMHRTL